jgi:hypothetical protein
MAELSRFVDDLNLSPVVISHFPSTDDRYLNVIVPSHRMALTILMHTCKVSRNGTLWILRFSHRREVVHRQVLDRVETTDYSACV